MTLGERLKKARGFANIKQQELEKRSGVDQATISKIERGDQLGSTEIVQLAVACGVRPEWLAMEEGPMIAECHAAEPWEENALNLLRQLPPSLRAEEIRGIYALTEFLGEREQKNGTEQ